jgi:hypothetical protein
VLAEQKEKNYIRVFDMEQRVGRGRLLPYLTLALCIIFQYSNGIATMIMCSEPTIACAHDFTLSLPICKSLKYVMIILGLLT